MLPYRYWLQIEDEQGSSIVGLLVGLSTQPCRKSTNQLRDYVLKLSRIRKNGKKTY